MGVVLALVPLSINGELGLTSVGWYMPTEPMLLPCCCPVRVGCLEKDWIGRFGSTLSRGWSSRDLCGWG